jgi:small-conductance mechanosensitive channel
MTNSDKFIETVEKYFLNSQIQEQSISLLACFIFSYAAYRLIRKLFFPKLITYSLKKNVELNRFVTKYFIPMAYPIFSIFFLILGIFIASFFIKEWLLLSLTLKLFSLFAFLRFMRISTNSTFIANFIGLFLVPALILDVFGLFHDVTNYLDDFEIKIGAVRISIYIAIKSIIVLMIVFWFASIITKKTKSFIEANDNIKSTNKALIGKFIDIFIYCSVSIIILKTVGVQMTTFAVVGGAVGVGIGFGLQKIASNFISGIILLFERSIEIGDWVEIDNGSILGIVKHFGGRYTLIECFDGKEIMVPNEDFIINRVNNWTFSNNRARIEILFSVAYGTDLQKAIDVAMEVARQHSRCLSYPEIECYVTNFGEFDIKMVLYFWVSDITKGRLSVRSDVYVEITKKFRENGIEIPIPKREVSFREVGNQGISEF